MPVGTWVVGGLIGGIISLVLGIIILIWPRFLAFLIGLWLVIIGIITIVAALR